MEIHSKRRNRQNVTLQLRLARNNSQRSPPYYHTGARPGMGVRGVATPHLSRKIFRASQGVWFQ